MGETWFPPCWLPLFYFFVFTAFALSAPVVFGRSDRSEGQSLGHG